jgi:NTP pyrophosphatase (non-canonical NTP hydrolase)
MGNDHIDLNDLQHTVYRNVTKRGYLNGRTPWDVVQRQTLKAVEELGEVARCVFDGEYPPASEIADVAIPLFVMAQECGVDLLAEVLRKSTADIERGVRQPLQNDTSDNRAGEA